MRDNYQKAVLFDYPTEIPTFLSTLPRMWEVMGEDLLKVAEKYPEYFPNAEQNYQNRGKYFGTYAAGEHVDAWGCVWSNHMPGHEAIVTGHPVPTREDVHKLKAPAVDAGLPHGFMYLRLADLRGFEELMIDFAEEPLELQMLIDIVRDYNATQIKKVLDNGPGWIMSFGDDLGMQDSLAMGPEKWRKYLKPAFKTLYQPIKEAGVKIFMHTDGCIHEIIPDLIECGVDVINPQYRANGVDNLQRVCRGKVCVQLDLDRQLFPFGTQKDIDDMVREGVEKLYLPEGGLTLIAEVDEGVPIQNICWICDAMRKYRVYKK